MVTGMSDASAGGTGVRAWACAAKRPRSEKTAMSPDFKKAAPVAPANAPPAQAIGYRSIRALDSSIPIPGSPGLRQRRLGIGARCKGPEAGQLIAVGFADCAAWLARHRPGALFSRERATWTTREPTLPAAGVSGTGCRFVDSFPGGERAAASPEIAIFSALMPRKLACQHIAQGLDEKGSPSITG